MKYILFVILTVTACWVITSVKKEAPAKEPTKEEKTAKESLSEEEFLLPMEKEFIEGGIFYSKCPPDGVQAQGPNRVEHGWDVYWIAPTSWVSDPRDPNNVIIEKIIRLHLKKPTGTLTKSDLEKVRALNIGWGCIQPFGPQLTSVECLVKLTHLKWLDLGGNKLPDVKGLEKLTQLDMLVLEDNPDLTKAQIDQLQKALPKCWTHSNPKKQSSLRVGSPGFSNVCRQ